MHATANIDVATIQRFVGEETEQISGGSPNLPFALHEYTRRRRELQARMVDAGIEVFVITSPDTMCWLSGYTSRWYRSGASTALPPCQCIVLHADSDAFFMIETAFHEHLVGLTSCVEDLRLLPDTGLTREPTAVEFVGFLVDNLAAERWLGGSVGLEAYSWVPSPAVWHAIVEGLEAEGCRVVDGSRTARSARQQKSQAEIAYIEEAQRCCDAGIRSLQQNARPGMSGLEGWKHYVAGVVDAGGEPAAIQEAVFGGPPEPMAHLLSSRAPIGAGQYFHADAAAAFERYHARCTRVLSFGPPRSELTRLASIAGGALELLRGSRAGDPFSQLKTTLREYFIAEGLGDQEFFAGGYELGISFAPEWVGEYLWSAHDPDDGALIPERLVTNIESVAFVAIVDTVVFEADGARTLSTLPTEVLIAGE